MVSNHSLQQVLPVHSHALDGRRGKQISGISQRGTQPLAPVVNVQIQVEMCGMTVPGQPFDVQFARRLLREALTAGGLEVEHYLEQWVQAQAALRLQRLHQLFERQVLMGLCVQCPLPDLTQQLGNARLPIDIGLEHLGVDEEAYKPLGFSAVAVGDRHADADVLLATVAMQQRLERSEQQHEQRHAFALSQGVQISNQRGRQFYKQTRAAMALLRRTQEVERQFEHRLLTAQQVAPVVELTRFLASLHPITLPYGVIGVLDRQRRQLQIPALAERAVQLHQFLDHDLHRPPIGDDMVLHQHQYMVIRGEAQQINTQQRFLLQVERTGNLRFHGGLEVRLQHVAAGDCNRRRLTYNLYSSVVFLAHQRT